MSRNRGEKACYLFAGMLSSVWCSKLHTQHPWADPGKRGTWWRSARCSPGPCRLPEHRWRAALTQHWWLRGPRTVRCWRCEGGHSPARTEGNEVNGMRVSHFVFRSHVSRVLANMKTPGYEKKKFCETRVTNCNKHSQTFREETNINGLLHPKLKVGPPFTCKEKFLALFHPFLRKSLMPANNTWSHKYTRSVITWSPDTKKSHIKHSRSN